MINNDLKCFLFSFGIYLSIHSNYELLFYFMFILDVSVSKLRPSFQTLVLLSRRTPGLGMWRLAAQQRKER